jgi:hypothetical protein
MGHAGGATDPMAMTATYQALVFPASGKLYSIALFVNPKGATCDLKVEVYAAAGAPGAMKPTGAILATSDVVPMSSINPLGGMQEFFFSGANKIDLQAGQLYAFVFTYSGQFPGQGQYVYLGMGWIQTLPNNCGFHQNGWQNDDYGTITFYIYTMS